MDFHINRRSRDTGSKVTLYMIINTYSTELTSYILESWTLDIEEAF